MYYILSLYFVSIIIPKYIVQTSSTATNFTECVIIDIGNGIYDVSTPIHLNNSCMTISGNGPADSAINYIGNENDGPLFACEGSNCYLRVSNLSISSSNPTDVSQWQQLFALGGTVEFENVLFDGNNYAQPRDNTAFWELRENAQLTFTNCIFCHNNVKYLFDGGYTLFNNCSFINNTLVKAGGIFNDDGMFYIQHFANLAFQDCVFKDNANDLRSIFYVSTGSSLTIQHTEFMNNKGYNFFVDTILYIDSTAACTVNITDSLFHGNSDYSALIFLSDDTNCYININETTFENNILNLYEMDINGGHFTLSNAQFLNGQSDTSISLWGVKSVLIENTIWHNYDVFDVIHKARFDDAFVIFDNITVQNILGQALVILDASSPITIINSKFYNVTAYSGYGAGVCVVLNQNDLQYTIKNTLFQQCIGINSQGAGIFVTNAGANSLFEDLTFIDNIASDRAADAYIGSKAKVIINGTWYLSGSQSSYIPSSTYFFAHGPQSWEIIAWHWIIKDMNQAAIWFSGVNFHFHNLTATENNNGLIYVRYSNNRNNQMVDSISDSYFADNNGILIFYHGSTLLGQSSSVTLINNTFKNNKDGILAITSTISCSIITSIASQTLYFDHNGSAKLSNGSFSQANSSYLVSAMKIIGFHSEYGLSGTFFGCTDLTCVYNNFYFNTRHNELSFTVDAINSTVPISAAPVFDINDESSTAIFNKIEINNLDAQYKFVGTNAKFVDCSFVDNSLISTKIHAKETDGMFYVTNSGILMFEHCMFQRNEMNHKVLFSIDSGSLSIKQTHFINNTGNASSHGIVSADCNMGQICNITVTDSFFNGNTGHNSDFYIYGYVHFTVRNSQFSHGVPKSASFLINNSNDILLQNVIWENYIVPNVIYQHTNNDSSIKYKNITIRNIIGRGIYTHNALSPV
eukprot:201614_1